MALTRTLTGTGTLTARQGAIAGMNVEQLLKRLEQRPLSIAGDFRRGRTPFEKFNATVKIAPKTFVIGEVAHSDAAGVMTGDAYRVDVRHSSDKVEARVHYGRSDNTFSNVSLEQRIINAVAVLKGER